MSVRRPPRLVRVAVPVPLAEALTYAVPERLASTIDAGVRVRVPVGRRRLVGVVLGWTEEVPAGVAVREIESAVDLEPVLPPDLLDLGAWIADYYLAPIGEVMRSVVPSGMPGLGDRRIWLTDTGALAARDQGLAGRIVDALREGGRVRASELQATIGEEPVSGVLESLIARGRIAVSGGTARGVRYVQGVSLAPRAVEELEELCGRSEPARRVVRFLAEIGRPATQEEVCTAVSCGSGVLSRLLRLGVLQSFTQVEERSLARHRMEPRPSKAFELRPDQGRAVGALGEAVESDEYRAFLLAGITGSGKTEVYLRGVEAARKRGRGAIILVPEIALVPALARAVRERFGERVALLHSSLSAAERNREWERIRRGEATIVLGPRSAILAPVGNLGFVVVDEEQDSSYKQDISPRYNGRDVALVRARAAGAVVLLVSATPSLESRLNVERGKLEALRLTERVGTAGLPEGRVVDLRAEAIPRLPGEVQFSLPLLEEIEAVLARGEQIILLRNRRGYAPMLICRACGERFECDDCGLPRTVHAREDRLLCHYCGSSLPVPASCPACASEVLDPVGAGTERVEERFRELFPAVSVEILDRDVARRPGGVAAVLDRFERGESQVLVGTQMVSKGHHFPRVALTAVLLADSYLGFPDFRAVEKTYTLLTQLAGRAGRGDRPGRVVLQTYQPDHYAIRAALENDDEAFAREEMRFRRVFHYPPFTRMVQLLFRDRSRDRARDRAQAVGRAVLGHDLGGRLRVSGPAPAPFVRLQGRWRYQLLLRSDSSSALRRVVRDTVGITASGEVAVDVDPQQLL